MAKVIPIGKPANESETQAIAFLRDNLPEGWLIFHNFELRQGTEEFEIDIAIIASHAVYLVDVKGGCDNVEVSDGKWYPEGRQHYHSPLAKLRKHARVMSVLLSENNKGIAEIRKVHVHAAVLLTADNACLSDRAGKEEMDVTDYKRCNNFFADKSKIPSYCLPDICQYRTMIADAIKGKAVAISASPVFGSWQVVEKLGGCDRYKEYRAKHSMLGVKAAPARLRVYKADPLLDEMARKEELKRISNAFIAVKSMSPHTNVLSVADLFPSADGDKITLVTDDISGQSLRQYLRIPNLALNIEQKYKVIKGVLAALDHAHKSLVVHRNLTPDAVLIANDGTARVTDFDFARVGKHRSMSETIAHQIVEELDPLYRAPELILSEYKSDPREASVASDIFSIGVIFYEMLTGELPFKNNAQLIKDKAKFSQLPSILAPDFVAGCDEWLQKFCKYNPEERYSSTEMARKALDDLIHQAENTNTTNGEVAKAVVAPQAPDDLTNLQEDYILEQRFRIHSWLGSGTFGVAYKVFDSLGDVECVLKLVTKDRISEYGRLHQEYSTLKNLPLHTHVVKVAGAGFLTNTKQTPYILFNYVEGLNVADLIDREELSLDDAICIARQTASGLDHLHEYGFFHQDVKPSNLLWTDNGVIIIDFNVAVSESGVAQSGGGTSKYLPPDCNSISGVLESPARIDRDLYALGITFYECVTGEYPFDAAAPPLKTDPKDPRQFQGCADLSSYLSNMLLKMIAPERKDRFASVREFLNALDEDKCLRREPNAAERDASTTQETKLIFKPTKPNSNPFVRHLLTLYSQNQESNAGTRGLNEVGKATYVSTYLDERLEPALLAGKFSLVIISGNAGDGKTAFIQQFEDDVASRGVKLNRSENGAEFQLNGRKYQSNYDGSQDEGSELNDVVLKKFFAPFAGENASSWPKNQTRLIAINEGRLVDFFLKHKNEFRLIEKQIHRGLMGDVLGEGIAVINLNLRSVVAEPEKDMPSIMERLIEGMTSQENWLACEKCDLKSKCYAYHNAITFQDPVARPKIIERLKMLYTITHLRGRLHITMRDLRSALAFMLVGTRDCDGIHQLYKAGDESLGSILDSFYFNSWLGGTGGTIDRLISLLKEIDVAEVSNPALDRDLDFHNPKTRIMDRFSFTKRAGYDNILLEKLFQDLDRNYGATKRSQLIEEHQAYLTHIRRRFFFECRDNRWKDMLPYTHIESFRKALEQTEVKSPEIVKTLIHAINRGEGLSNPTRLGNQLALRVRQVDKGTIRSYRLFKGEHFAIRTELETPSDSFVECFPQTLFLEYDSGDGHKARLGINLDIHEMLMRLGNGYRPSIEEREGFYLSLLVFKNILASAPYQDVLLTERGFDFFEIHRDNKGILHMSKLIKEVKA